MTCSSQVHSNDFCDFTSPFIACSAPSSHKQPGMLDQIIGAEKKPWDILDIPISSYIYISCSPADFFGFGQHVKGQRGVNYESLHDPGKGSWPHANGGWGRIPHGWLKHSSAPSYVKVLQQPVEESAASGVYPLWLWPGVSQSSFLLVLLFLQWWSNHVWHNVYITVPKRPQAAPWHQTIQPWHLPSLFFPHPVRYTDSSLPGKPHVACGAGGSGRLQLVRHPNHHKNGGQLGTWTRTCTWKRYDEE